MREIKFRGLDVMTGNWVYGNLIQTGVGMHYIIPRNYIADAIPKWRIDRDTLGQYTGLKDINGMEIYEGDIADVDYHGFRRFRVQIVFGKYKQDGSGGEYTPEKCIGFYAKALNPNDLDEYECRVVPEYLEEASIFSFDSIEIIGNIHENPILLKEE